MFKIGDRVRVTDQYPAYNQLRWTVGRVCSVKPSDTGPVGRLAIKIDFDEAPGDGRGGLVFYDYELEKLQGRPLWPTGRVL